MTTITLRQARNLVRFFGGHDSEVHIAENFPGHPDGLVAWCADYPEEGVEYLGPTEVSDELARSGTNWAEDLGRLEQGDIELMEDAIAALLQPGNHLAHEHALDGLQKRVEAARQISTASHCETESADQTLPADAHGPEPEDE